MNTLKAGRTPTRNDARSRANKQKGAVLFIALIVLVSMMLASIALIRSVDTANVIAGNLAFKQATLQAGDFGVEAAAAALPTIALAANVNTTVTPGPAGTPAYWYYHTRRDTDANGVPTQREAGAIGALTPIDWVNSVPISTTVAGNDVRIVIDRLCRGPGIVTDVEGNCFHEEEAAPGSRSYVIGHTAFTPVTAVFYRVTAHVTGPRNTVSVVQAIVSCGNPCT